MENNYPFEIVDYATGIQGTYCIGQRVAGAPAFIAYWNPAGWAGSGYVFTDKELVEAIVGLLEKCRAIPVEAAKEAEKHD
jgi:hypothetical protein